MDSKVEARHNMALLDMSAKKPSSRVTTCCDKENQALLTMDCDHLQGSFTSPHSLSVNGNSNFILGETIPS